MMYAIVKFDGSVEEITGYKDPGEVLEPDQIRTLANGLKMLRPLQIDLVPTPTSLQKTEGPFEEILPDKVRRYWTVVDLPADVIANQIAREQRIDGFQADADRAEIIERLMTASPSQIGDFVESKVTDLQSVKTYLKMLTKALVLNVRG